MTLEEKTKSNRENITSGVLIFDEEQNVLMSSFGMSNITGIRQEKINIKSLIKFFKDYSEELKMGIKDAIFNNKNTSIKDVMLNNFVFEICISPLVDKDKNFSGGVVIIHDTTCLKEAEKIKREFVSVASHQIRTPLTGVKLFTDMLLREDVRTINEAQKTYLENVYHGVKTIVNLTYIFFSSRRRHTRLVSDWSSDVCSSDLMIRHTRLVSDWSSDVCSSDLEHTSELQSLTNLVCRLLLGVQTCALDRKSV